MFEAADIIASYTRREAIDDGVLIDITEAAKPAVAATVPFAITSAAWSRVARRLPETSDHEQAHRLSELLKGAREAHVRGRQNEVAFSVLLDARTAAALELKLLVHPGDDGEPVVTIMLPEED